MLLVFTVFRPNVKRDRAIARGVQAPDQDPDRASLRRKAAMMFWALLASGQITMRKVEGWQTLSEKPTDQTIDLAA